MICRSVAPSARDAVTNSICLTERTRLRPSRAYQGQNTDASDTAVGRRPQPMLAANHLIVAHEVTTHGYVKDDLSMMAMAARDAVAPDNIEAIAEKGYNKTEEIHSCEEAEVAVVVPEPQTSNAGARGQFDKAVLPMTHKPTSTSVTLPNT